MTWEEISVQYPEIEFSQRADALISVLLEEEDFDEDVIKEIITEYSDFDDNYLQIGYETYRIMYGDDYTQDAEMYLESIIDDIEHSIEKSDIPWISKYINWDRYKEEEIDSYIDDFAEINGYTFLGSCYGYDIYRE